MPEVPDRLSKGSAPPLEGQVRGPVLVVAEEVEPYDGIAAASEVRLDCADHVKEGVLPCMRYEHTRPAYPRMPLHLQKLAIGDAAMSGRKLLEKLLTHVCRCQTPQVLLSSARLHELRKHIQSDSVLREWESR
eukprot:764216-Hanusia_phi.AAC.2